MIRRGAILALAASFVACGGARVPALSATDPAAVSPIDSTTSRGILNAGSDSPEPASPVARERPLLRGNPLWAVPLSALSATRERPLFSPSRRPPAPAVVAVPRAPVAARPAPKAEEPDHPLLTLVGTVAGETGGIGIFVDQATNNVIRLRTGENHDGWVLRSVQGREASFEKDQRAATLALPPPGAGPSGQPSVPIGVGAQVGATWMDGDGQLITPPTGRTSQSSAGPPVDPEVN
jgi:hypothetical protein